MEKNTKQRVALYTFYVLFVVLLLLGTRCESRVHLTTPEKDVKHIAELAETVHTEADLRKVEKLASQYEIAYRKSYGGAKALYFKSLYEPIVDEAGERRAAFRAEEDMMMAQEELFDSLLSDMDKAWTMELGSEEDERQKIAQNNEVIAQKQVALLEQIATKEQYAMDIVDAGYPQDMLNKLGEMEAAIVVAEQEIAEVEHNNYIITLANKLQRGLDLNVVVEEACDCECDCAEEFCQE